MTFFRIGRRRGRRSLTTVENDISWIVNNITSDCPHGLLCLFVLGLLGPALGIATYCLLLPRAFPYG